MHLALFAKYWSQGEAKSRLAASFGPRAATRLARAFLKTSVDRLAAIHATRHLVVTPDRSRRAFERIARGRFQISLQGPGALGERLQRWFENQFADGARRVVALGADSPDLPLEYVATAFAELEHYPAVIGPARDGGYYLLGLRDRALPLFDGVAWGTSAVFQQTRDRLRSLDTSHAVLPMWHDVDTAEDLALLRQKLSASVDADPAFERLLRTIRRVTDMA